MFVVCLFVVELNKINKMPSPGYKYCIVPKCKNTRSTTPDKLFFNVPRDAKTRRKWCKIMKRNDKIPLSSKTTLHCCEDHFDLETDMDNYIKYRLVGGRLKLKQEVTPHKFACQKTEQRNPVERPGYKKRQQIEFLERVLNPNICHENLITQKVEFVSCEADDSNNKPDIDPIGDNMTDTHVSPKFKSVGVQVNIRTKPKYRSKATNTDAEFVEWKKCKLKQKLFRKRLLDETIACCKSSSLS